MRTRTHDTTSFPFSLGAHITPAVRAAGTSPKYVTANSALHQALTTSGAATVLESIANA